MKKDIYVRILITTDKWITVSAEDFDDAIKQAKNLPCVTNVLEASYIPGGVIT